MHRRSWVVLVTAFLAGLAITFAAPAVPAVSQVSPPASPPIPIDVDLGLTGQLVARGAVVVVPVTVTCAPGGEFPFVQVTLTQRRGNRVARGFGFIEGFGCTGFPTTVGVNVTAENLVFRRGIAFAQATLSLSYGGFFVSDTDSGTITLLR
jgi:hypothetical protein